MTYGRERIGANLIRFFVLLLKIWVVLSAEQSMATHQAVELQSGYEHYSLNAYASYLVDVDGKFTLTNVDQAAGWQVNVSGGVLNLGFTPATVWVKIRLVIPENKDDVWYLVVPYPLLENVHLFIVDREGDGVVRDLAAGRRVQSHYLHFPLPDTNGRPVDLLLQVKSFSSLQIPIELWSQHFLINRQNVETVFWGIYFGVLLALIAYNSFLYLSMRDMAYFNYVLYLCSIVVLMLCISGFGSLYVWSGQDVVRYLLPISAGLASLWAILFALTFLQGRGVPQRLNQSLWIVALASLVLVVYSLNGSDNTALLAGLLSLFSMFVVILAGLSAWASGVAIARYFVLAWATFGFGTLIYILNIFNLVPVSRFTTHAVQVGSALEAVLLSFSLAHRIKEERQQKLTALEQKSVAEQQMKQAQTLALEQALHDSLTQRPNDALLMQRVQDLLRMQRAVDDFAMILFYCPQMKEISSSLGRRLAEEVFCSVVEDMNRIMASDPQNIAVEKTSNSFVAVTEFGSFVALCSMDVDGEPVQTYAKRYLSLYDKSVDIDGVLLNLDMVCGIACYPRQGDRADLLLQHASAARDFGLRTAEVITIYSHEIEAFSRRRLMLIGALTQAIQDHELELYLQPQIQSENFDLVGAEALLRWNSPRFGAVSPQEFIEIAEEAGLMKMLTQYVIDEAFALLHGLYCAGLDISISINLSVQNLVEPGLVHYVTKAAAITNIDLSDVIFEVTESSVSERMDQVIDNLQQLAGLGCSIALDDFGTGYSSLAYLSRLPIHELKIDRSFIANMQNSDSDFRIVENTVKLARALQIQTVAEGVEDEVTMAQIMRLGCDKVQGYYVAKPMPVFQFREWVLRRGAHLLERSANQ